MSWSTCSVVSRVMRAKAVPPATTVAPTGTLWVVLRGGRVEVHYQIEDTAVRSAHREAAKAEVRRRVGRGLVPEAERKRLYTLLTRDRWTGDPLVRRWMRGQWRRGHNHTGNQIIIRSDNVRTVPLTDGAEVWLSVPGLTPRTSVAVPPATTVAPAGTLRVILRGGRVEVHYQIDDTAVTSARRACGAGTVGVDKGYSEVLVDSDGDHHGPELGELLRSRSDPQAPQRAAGGTTVDREPGRTAWPARQG